MRLLILLVLVGPALFVMTEAGAQPNDNPYSKTFDDFDWDENEERVPVLGALPLGVMPSTEALIRRFEQRVESNPKDFVGLATLGQLYFRHAKEADDLQSYGRATEALEKSLSIYPEYASAKVRLAEVYAARHRFEEGLSLAAGVFALNPNSVNALEITTDCQIELGRYDEAKSSIDKLTKLETSPPVFARQALFTELMGDTKKAISLIDQAITELDEMGAKPNELKWYQWRKGTLLFGRGKIKEAEQLFLHVLAAAPHDHASLMALAQTQHARGDTAAAIKSTQLVVELFAAPPAMAQLGDLYLASGNSQLADQWYAKTEATMRKELVIAGDAHAREVALFFADHNRNLEEALALATEDLRRRQDLYSYDTLAWCQFRVGDFASAKANIEKALEHGTQDAKLFSHAALISKANGNEAESAQWTQRMTELNPHFSILPLK